MPRGGISGMAVVVATAGSLLIYAGVRGVSPVQALRDISTGKAPGIAGTDAGLDTSVGVLGGAGDAINNAVSGAVGAAVVAAAERFKGDRYSQARRWAPGYSDCSSFVGKALKAVGIKPPAGSTTASYYLSQTWKEVPLASAQAGDVIVSATAATVGAHMVLATGNGNAIGQQNPRRNVQQGRITDLMAGTPYRYIAKRYAGSAPGKAKGSGRAASAGGTGSAVSV